MREVGGGERDCAHFMRNETRTSSQLNFRLSITEQTGKKLAIPFPVDFGTRSIKPRTEYHAIASPGVIYSFVESKKQENPENAIKKAEQGNEQICSPRILNNFSSPRSIAQATRYLEFLKSNPLQNSRRSLRSPSMS